MDVETRKRSLLKAVTWQACGLVTMGFVGLAFTGSVVAGGALAVTSTCVGLLGYIVHERVWARVSWGRSHLEPVSKDTAP
ncbi:MAG: DUF2061 domain-containing protein [Devosia sp.]